MYRTFNDRRRLCEPDPLDAAVLVIFWFFFLVPYIGQWLTAPTADPGRRLLLGAGDFHLVRAAYFCEIIGPAFNRFRAARNKRRRPGHELRDHHGLHHLAQAFRNMVPVLLTQTIILFQDTPVYVISVTDFLGAASKIAQRDGVWLRCTCLPQ